MRRFTIAALTVATTLGAVLTAVPAVPAEAHRGRPVLGPENCVENACHFDVPVGTYDVTVRLGADTAASTAITGETRRTLPTSVHGATVYADLVRDELVAQGLVPEGRTRVA